jgi:hypothetical protein
MLCCVLGCVVLCCAILYCVVFCAMFCVALCCFVLCSSIRTASYFVVSRRAVDRYVAVCLSAVNL